MSNDQRGRVTEAAQAISRLGAAKGGKERAARLTPDERRAIAKQAAIARAVAPEARKTGKGHPWFARSPASHWKLGDPVLCA